MSVHPVTRPVETVKVFFLVSSADTLSGFTSLITVTGCKL